MQRTTRRLAASGCAREALHLGLVRYERPPNGAKFVVPPWAAQPSAGVALHVTKNGGTISTLKLDGGAKYYMFGRAPQTCADGHGFVINHPTLSRQHAVVVHAENESLYLIDLGSPHGTTVNQERVEAYTPRLLENGNIMCFGQSTRKYVIRVFPREEKLLRAGSRLSLTYKRLAGLRVSTDGDGPAIGDGTVDGDVDDDDADDDDDEDDDDDDDDDDEEEEGTTETASSPSSKRESERRRYSLKQARLFTGLNSCVSYPSPKSLLGRKPNDSPVSPSVSAADVAAAMAASASPAASPVLRPAAKPGGAGAGGEAGGTGPDLRAVAHQLAQAAPPPPPDSPPPPPRHHGHQRARSELAVAHGKLEFIHEGKPLASTGRPVGD